jgi:hypothetical protein
MYFKIYWKIRFRKRFKVKSLSGHPKFILVLMAMAMATLGCSLGGQLSNTISQLATVSSATQIVQTVAAVAGTPPSPQSTAATPSHGTPDEAKSMLKKAVAHYISVGRKQALSDFTQRVAPFFDHDLYVACIDSTLTQSANGGYPNLVGGTVEPLSRSAWDAAKTGTISSITYDWLNPATGEMAPKTFFL